MLSCHAKRSTGSGWLLPLLLRLPRGWQRQQACFALPLRGRECVRGEESTACSPGSHLPLSCLPARPPADVPGLLEGAHAGVGLGHQFLRHVQRCRVLVHLVGGRARARRSETQRCGRGHSGAAGLGGGGGVPAERSGHPALPCLASRFSSKQQTAPPAQQPGPPPWAPTRTVNPLPPAPAPARGRRWTAPRPTPWVTTAQYAPSWSCSTQTSRTSHRWGPAAAAAAGARAGGRAPVSTAPRRAPQHSGGGALCWPQALTALRRPCGGPFGGKRAPGRARSSLKARCPAPPRPALRAVLPPGGGVQQGGRARLVRLLGGHARPAGGGGAGAGAGGGAGR